MNDTSYASAPPSVGNMAVGFDILGHALDAEGDQIRATRTSTKGVQMGQVSGVVTQLPTIAANNTAGCAVESLLKAQNADFGVQLDIHKGIALGSGMGGSAASAVAAVVAVNALLDKPLPQALLLEHALAGEAVASGAIHGDNVAPSLLGGIVFVPPKQPAQYVSIPVPDNLYCVLVRPDIRLDTSSGRSILSRSCLLSDVIDQTAHLAALICACYDNNLERLRLALNDTLIEPQRSHQIDGFARIKAKALSAGALGFSLSGSGPSMIAWCHKKHVLAVAAAMENTVANYYADYEKITSSVNARGGHIISANKWRGVNT